MADIYGNLNLHGHVIAGGEFKNFKPETLAIDPTAEELTAPRIWFNTNAETLKYYDGTTVHSLGDLTTDQLNSALRDYAAKTDLSVFLTEQQLLTALGDYMLKTALADALQPYAKTSDVVTRASLTASFYNVITETAQTHDIVHNLGYKFPVVQCFDTSTGYLVTPDILQAIDENTMFIRLRTPMMLNVNVIWTKPKQIVE